MIGSHTVTIAPAASTVPVNLNPYFSTSAASWQSGGFEDPIAWADGQVVQARGGGLFPNQTAPVVPRLPGDVTYRVRCRMTKGTAGPLKLSIQVGDSADAVWGGPFWKPGHAESMIRDFGYTPHGPGTFTWDFVVPASWHPEFPYIGACLLTDYVNLGGFTQYVDSLELVALPGSVADLSCLVDQVSIQHGRADTTAQPTASTCTVDLTTDPDTAALLASVDVGARLDVMTTVPGYAAVYRFTGRVTDMNLGWDDEGANTPTAGVAQIIAVASMADLGRRVVGSTPFPQEDDGDRVARVAELAGMPLDRSQSDPGTVQILPRDIDSQPALAVMQGTAGSAGGFVWQNRTGDLMYADANHRRNVPVGLELDSCDVLVTPTWVRNLDGLTNDVSIGYGAKVGNDQPRYTRTDQNSIDKWGRYGFTTTTELVALADATAMGNLLVIRNSQPAWILSAIPVDVEGLTAPDTYALLSLDINALTHLTGMPAIGNAPTTMFAWVEGWREVLTGDAHDLELVLSDYCRTSVPLVWDDPPATTWDTVPSAATRTWDQSTCFGGPLPGVGRWDDTLTSLRWDQVLPATTWDTWAGV